MASMSWPDTQALYDLAPDYCPAFSPSALPPTAFCLAISQDWASVALRNTSCVEYMLFLLPEIHYPLNPHNLFIMKTTIHPSQNKFRKNSRSISVNYEVIIFVLLDTSVIVLFPVYSNNAYRMTDSTMNKWMSKQSGPEVCYKCRILGIFQT